MRLLLVYCHPDPDSLAAAIRRTAVEALRAAGHELREIDLYAEGFDPVLRLEEKRSYLTDTARNIAGVQGHVDALRWAEGWIAIYPTWNYGLPAMLKGWFDRVWLPGVSFRIAPAREKTIRGELANIRFFAGITTSGAPWWWLRVIADPGRSFLMRGLRPLYAKGCRMHWLQLYNMNHVTQDERTQFLQKVGRELPRIVR